MVTTEAYRICASFLKPAALPVTQSALPKHCTDCTFCTGNT